MKKKMGSFATIEHFDTTKSAAAPAFSKSVDIRIAGKQAGDSQKNPLYLSQMTKMEKQPLTIKYLMTNLLKILKVFG